MSSTDQIVLSATCHTCPDPPGFTNFRVSSVDGGVVFDAHSVGICAVTVPREEVRRLHYALSTWL